MLTLFLVCLVVGGVLLALSLFAGGDAADGLEVDADAGDIDPGVDGEGVAAAVRFLSVRNLVFFTAFFGLTGTLLSLLGSRPVVTLAAAVSLGSLAAFAITQLMRYLRGSESGGVPGLDSFEGAPARVVVDVARERSGKVAVTCGDRSHHLVARIHESAGATRLRTGELALVVRMENGVAWIAESTYLA